MAVPTKAKTKAPEWPLADCHRAWTYVESERRVEYRHRIRPLSILVGASGDVH